MCRRGIWETDQQEQGQLPRGGAWGRSTTARDLDHAVALVVDDAVGVEAREDDVVGAVVVGTAFLEPYGAVWAKSSTLQGIDGGLEAAEPPDIAAAAAAVDLLVPASTAVAALDLMHFLDSEAAANIEFVDDSRTFSIDAFEDSLDG